MHTPTRAHSHMHTHQSDLIPTISTEKKKMLKIRKKRGKMVKQREDMQTCLNSAGGVKQTAGTDGADALLSFLRAP